MIDKNRKTYKSSKIVNYYKYLSQLQPAEKNFIKHFQAQLSNFKMLDIGIGGGRTTQHFAPLVKEYVGIDYASEMIEACHKRFGSVSNVSLKVMDARDMNQFADNSFDFVLFSFNGIDYVPHSDRMKIFKEVARVGKSGCYFFFSSHNLQSIAKEFDYKNKLSLNIFRVYVDSIMFAFLRLFNLSITLKKLPKKNYCIIRDESHNFQLKTYYVRPQEQIKQLSTSFYNIKIFSWQSGKQILDMNETVIDCDMWLYYL